MNNYNFPPFFDPYGREVRNDETLLKKLQKCVEDSQNFLRSQRYWPFADICMNLYFGESTANVLKGTSSLEINKISRQIQEAVATQFNLQPNVNYRTKKTNDVEMVKQAKILDQLFQDTWISQKVGRTIRRVGDFTGGAGSGFLFCWPQYDALADEIVLKHYPISHKHILVLHGKEEADIQDFQNVTIRLELPLTEALDMYPSHSSIIKSDRDAPGWLFKRLKKLKQGLWKGVVGHFRNRDRLQSTIQSSYPTCDIFHTFLKDDCLNKTGETLIVGDITKHWGYKVPSYYDSNGLVNKVDTGRKSLVYSDDGSGEREEPIYRDVTLKECKIFPRGRHIIWTNFGIIYDGPPMWGNGLTPVAPFRFRKMPSEFLGVPIALSVRSLESSANNLLRSIENSITGKLRVPVGVDTNADPTLIKAIQQGGVRGLLGKVFKYRMTLMEKALIPLLPKEFFDIDNRAFEYIGELQKMMDYQMNTTDFASMAGLKQLPASDTQDALLRNIGPLAIDHSNEIEYGMSCYADIFLGFVDQLYPLERRLVILGKDGVTLDSIDYNPSSFVPLKDLNDSRPFWLRLNNHLKNFSVFAVSSSMQERNSMTNRLTLMQMLKIGAKIPSRLLYEICTNGAYGEYSELEEEYYEEQGRAALVAAVLNMAINQMQQNAAPENNIFKNVIEALKGGDYNRIKEIMGGQNAGEGQPPSFNQSPRLDSSKTDSSGIPRTTTTTS
jgi:hypothetical protein